MELLINFLILALSVSLVLFFSSVVVRNSISLAVRLHLSDEFIGMTILSIGTSIPEIATHMAASFKILKDPTTMNELSALAVGTNIGSDIFQQCFVIGIIALVGTVTISKRDTQKNVGGLIIAGVVILLVSIGEQISRLEGGLLVASYIGYVFLLHKLQMVRQGDTRETTGSLTRNIVLIAFGFIFISVGADLALDEAVVIVKRTGLSYSFFGVIVLGVITALPELATSLVSVLKKRGAVSAGILIGSNITNPIFALGLGALVSGYTVPTVIVWYDLPFNIVSALPLYVLFMKHGTLKKSHAFLMIFLYLGYLYFRNLYFPTDQVL